MSVRLWRWSWPRSRYLAEDALEQISVDYDPLPVVADAEEARRSDTTLVHDEAGSNVLLSRQFAQGEVDTAIETAAVRVRERFRFHRHAAVCMENRGCVAEYQTSTGFMTLRSATQCPGLLRDVLADLLDLPEHCVRRGRQ